MSKSKFRRTAFVPRVLWRGAALASVIPACAAIACGSDSTGSSTDSGPSSGFSSGFPGVAAVAYPAYESSGRGSGASSGSGGAPDVFLGGGDVAVGAYGNDAPDAQPDVPDGASDAPTRPDVFLGVAAVAYPAYEAGRG
jgi:hypothetical protein